MSFHSVTCPRGTRYGFPLKKQGYHTSVMTARWMRLGLGLMCLLGAVTARASVSEDVPALKYFPLFKGSVWTYEGPATWTVADSNGEVRQERLTFRMEVTETYQRGPIWLAMLHGHPLDAVFYEQGKAPSRTAYLCVGYQVYELNEQRAVEALRRLQNANDHLGDLVQVEDLAFDFPLLSGKRFGGPPDQITREDGWYQWAVLGPAESASGSQPVSADEVELRYSSVPDETRIRFKKGEGIAGCDYVHHGTISEVHLTLTSFQQGAPHPSPTLIQNPSGEK